MRTTSLSKARGRAPRSLKGPFCVTELGERGARILLGLAVLASLVVLPGIAMADEIAPAAPAASAGAPDLATRVADLEAYVTNGAPKALSSSGPGHNAWMMASSALVLFMTLPGLALFYGGLVRRKNV